MLSACLLSLNLNSVKALETYNYQAYDLEAIDVSSQIRVTRSVVYFKGSTVQNSIFVTQQFNGYYYSGWIPLTNRITHADGSTTATYSGYIYGGSATNSKVIQD